MSIHDLIRDENYDEVKKLLTANPHEIFAIEKDNLLRTPLHIAVGKGNDRIIELLFAIQQRVNNKSVKTHSEIKDKSDDDKPDIVDIPDEVGDTAFHYACRQDNSSYLIRLLYEHGANIDRLDDKGSTGLFNIIFEVDENKSENDYQCSKKAKVLLELGANCHLICLGKTIFEWLDIKNLSCDWWTMLLDVGAGLYADFSNITVNIEFLRAMTANQIIIGATKDGIPVTRATPGFEKSITTEEELRSAIYQGKSFQYKALITSAKHLAKLHPNDTLLVNHLTQMIELFTSKTVKNMEEISINYLVRNFLLDSNASKIPPDLLDKCKAREEQVLQQALRGGAL